MEAIEGGNLTVTLQGGYEVMQEPVAGFVNGYSIPMEGQLQIVVDNDAFLDTMDEIEDLSKQMGDAVLSLRLIQSGDSITGFGLSLIVGEPKNETQIKAELIINISEIGTTEIDEEMQDAIVDEIPELDAFNEYYDF